MNASTSQSSSSRPGVVGPSLHVLMHGREIARLHSSREGRAKLVYLPGATEVTRGLSCCLPAVGVQYSGARVINWLGGLLPDRSEVLARWRSRYGIRRQDAYALLWYVGADVAGAAQFVRPDHLHDAEHETGQTEPLTDDDIGQRILALATDATAWAPSEGTGQFSLAGAQAKFALARTIDGWAEPAGSRATTHIFKPAIPHMPDQDLNEHLTMRLAAAVGLPVAPTAVMQFAGARSLVVTRFDRYRRPDGTWRRIHQEDAVQALGLSPGLKYESHGGPGVSRLVDLLAQYVTPDHAETDVATFIDAVAFNWLTMGTDAHARNFALMHHGQSTRLAPLYDLNSFLPYAVERPAHMAMKIGFTETDPVRISGRDWEELARDCRLDPGTTLARVRHLAEQLLTVSSAVLTADEATQWGSGLPRQLDAGLRAHVSACLRRL